MISVVFGSQTGNSEAIAKRISKDLKTLKIENEIESLNKFLLKFEKYEKSRNYILIIVCSTTGNGDIPENSEKFFRYIKKKTHPSDLLSNVTYAVLGLGDSNYTKYQYIPKQIDDIFTKMGAKKFYKRGEADEAVGLENVVEPWIINLFPILEKLITDTSNQINNVNISNQNVVIKGKF